MTEKLLAAAVFTAGCTAFMNAEDVPNRTWDTLENKNPSAVIAPARALSPGEMTQLAGEQLVLCMIGDSVTWAEDGDHFRGELLKLLPQLAFAGTHSAVLGYSHAGEGGDSTVRVLNRLNDPERVPAAPYYHLMIGINDSSAAKRDCDSDAVAAAAAGRIGSILEQLLAKPMTRKVFLGAILPSPFDMKSGEIRGVRRQSGGLLRADLRDGGLRDGADARV